MTPTGVCQKCPIPFPAPQTGAFCAPELRSALPCLAPSLQALAKTGMQGKMGTIYTATAFLVRSPSLMGRLTQQEKPFPAQGLTNQHQAAQQIPAQEGRSLSASSQGRGDPCPHVVSPVSASCFGLSCLPCSPCSAPGFLLAGCLRKQRSFFFSVLWNVAFWVTPPGW